MKAFNGHIDFPRISLSNRCEKYLFKTGSLGKSLLEVYRFLHIFIISNDKSDHLRLICSFSLALAFS